ncbi:hypothetical protein DNTS_016147 [Danionella cerebrum]|uniref:Uncharacterized protein n=1 Tax=Danionella cerebrum TaxID=2873325 RepID=A0A553Q8U4_9TELE|nr:hypothetical protein DNTS_016147 [Danionella translucida]
MTRAQTHHQLWKDPPLMMSPDTGQWERDRCLTLPWTPPLAIPCRDFLSYELNNRLLSQCSSAFTPPSTGLQFLTGVPDKSHVVVEAAESLPASRKILMNYDMIIWQGSWEKLTAMEEGAADRCKEAIDKALQYDENNPEALQLMASYLFSIEKSENKEESSVITENMEEEEDERKSNFPPYEARITTAKLLIEAEEYEGGTWPPAPCPRSTPVQTSPFSPW